MQIEEVLKNIKGIALNSKEVKEGYLFVAIKGRQYDGHNFVSEALERGASLVLAERCEKAWDSKCVKVEDTRKALGEVANKFFGNPSEKLKVIGITGTNGKTTTTHIIESISRAAGTRPGLMGTIYYRLGDKIYGEGRTTPDSITWHRTFMEMLKDGANVVSAEVSSHALDQYRVWGTKFFMTVFTNLTQDHLDYHGSMEEYFRAKLKLFTEYDYQHALINIDNAYGKRIKELLGEKALTYGKKADLSILSFDTDIEGSQISVEFRGRRYSFYSNLVGEFQAYNLSAGILYGFLSGMDQSAIQDGLKGIYVPGRFQVHKGRGITVVVDYAHTPDALENLIRTIRKMAKGRVISVFGAGGNRDRSKRPLMGKAAERWSHLIVLTSDNPRDEEPSEIIGEVYKGIEDKSKVYVEEDRRKAIKLAIDMAKYGDIVVVAGKGHETYQEIKGKRYPFVDSDVVKEVLSA
ncbi:MAG: UDP-N-acetylmuramoyl-L-alanyl-D-glutamate--2,6-diaminopimelate ligase [Aquificaceae bacterium]